MIFSLNSSIGCTCILFSMYNVFGHVLKLHNIFDKESKFSIIFNEILVSNKFNIRNIIIKSALSSHLSLITSFFFKTNFLSFFNLQNLTYHLQDQCL